MKTQYDVAIVGSGHNGLIAACYLALAGLSVIVLEKNDYIGGATHSKKVFKGMDARLSVYSYLISLLPDKILTDLGITFRTQRRSIAKYLPYQKKDKVQGLLISNDSESVTRESFIKNFGSDKEYKNYLRFQDALVVFAKKVWPTVLKPLNTRAQIKELFKTKEERKIWDYIIEKPLASFIEDYVQDDLLRGMLFTDGSIGVFTDPNDKTLLQNKTFLYHIIGGGTGEWRVPTGGMGALTDGLVNKARQNHVTFATSAEVIKVENTKMENTVYFRKGGEEKGVNAKYVLFNCASNIANSCLKNTYEEKQYQGSVFKINMLLKKLPKLKDPNVSSLDAFRGTFHLYEGYEYLKEAYKNAKKGIQMDMIPGEMYCHSLTDPSILSSNLQKDGYQTLTLFGLDVPYDWFIKDNKKIKEEVKQKFIRGINSFCAESLESCLAKDSDGNICLEAKSPLDLETDVGLPKGNIFHGDLTWPFVESKNQEGTWGVETSYENVFMCGSSAKRGGAVSGIPGHNAAMKVLELVRQKAL